jgi:hypothetical protein
VSKSIIELLEGMRKASEAADYQLRLEVGTACHAQDEGCQVDVFAPPDALPFVGISVRDEVGESMLYLTPSEADRLSEALALRAHQVRSGAARCG